MSFHLNRSDETIQDGLRRIARGQIGKAVAELDDSARDLDATVHQARKRCKKLRGVIRLVRPAFADYGEENRSFREVAARLSPVRDSQAMIESYDGLVTVYDASIDRRAFGSIRRRLTERKKQIVGDRGLDLILSDVRVAMAMARKRAEEWIFSGDGFDVMAGGLAKTYRRARKALARARKSPTAQRLHEFRKRVKYHYYHANLLRSMWPGPLRAHRDAVDRLGEVLGEHHNLAVLRQVLFGAPRSFASPERLEAFAGLIDRRQTVLIAEAFAIADRVFAEKPSTLRRRWSIYWDVWRRD